MTKAYDGNVICVLEQKKEDSVQESGITYTKQFLPIYRVVDVSNLSIDLELSKNDLIITNSIPTRIVDNGEELFVINQDFIAAKIEN